MKSLKVLKKEEGFWYREKGLHIHMMFRGTILKFFYSFEKKNSALSLINAYEVPDIERSRWIQICRQAAVIGAQYKSKREEGQVQEKLF